jgi:hypothetical protein
MQTPDAQREAPAGLVIVIFVERVHDDMCMMTFGKQD